MSEVKISVCLDDAHLHNIEKIAQQLQSAGVSVEQSLAGIGIISGSIDRDRIQSLYQIEGVKQIEQQEVYQIAPPNSAIQ